MMGNIFYWIYNLWWERSLTEFMIYDGKCILLNLWFMMGNVFNWIYDLWWEMYLTEIWFMMGNVQFIIYDVKCI